MNIKLSDHGRSILEQLQPEMREKEATAKKPEPKQSTLALLQDVFTRSDVSQSKFQQNSADSGEEKPENADSIKTEGLNISFQFDLFYELSSKVEAKMGKSGANRFAELSGKVSETFMGSFNLSIDAVGSFMNGTDKSLDISPETTGQFFDAVEGLADLSPEALENFLKESDKFFASLEETYGKADGAFEAIKNTMQDQAKQFFADVGTARNDAMGAIEETAAEQAQALPQPPAAGDGTPSKEANGNKPLIELMFQPGKKVGQDDYKSFLEDFLKYANKFKQQMFEKLFSKGLSGYEKPKPAAIENSEKSGSAVDQAA